MLEDYLKAFSRLKRAPGKIWEEGTRRRAPHKPVLLLAVIDLVSRGVFTSPFLDVTGDLVEANELFNGYWRRVAPTGHTSSVAFPFSRLHNESFWELVAANGTPLDVSRLNINTLPQLRAVAAGARMDAQLFALMAAPEARQALRQVLLEAHFSPGAQASLAEQIAINDEAFGYSRHLYERAHRPMVAETVEEAQYKPLSRDQGFRRIVVATYDHRCALCGLRIITSEGHTAVDAAHIKPWSLSYIDDIRNGMALCKLCHWAFDRGVIGVSKSYQVIASRQIGTEPNLPGGLHMLAGRNLLTPEDRELWPSQEYLGWHRSEHRLNR